VAVGLATGGEDRLGLRPRAGMMIGSWVSVTVVPRKVNTPLSELRELLAGRGIEAGEDAGHGALVQAAYDALVEPNTVEPTFYTFYTDFPTSVSPLTQQHRANPRLAERFDLVAFGAEIGTACSELTDPLELRRRLEAQSSKAASGDVEAMELDEEFPRRPGAGHAAHRWPRDGRGPGADDAHRRLHPADRAVPVRQTRFVRRPARARMADVAASSPVGSVIVVLSV
jgi:hypothetical protein